MHSCKAIGHFVLQLLIEWQANVNAKNRSSKTALELLRNAELKQFLMDKYQQCRKLVLAVRQGNLVAVTEALLLHARRESTFANLRSRCIGGDTLFHVAASTGNSDAIETLIQQNVDCNVLNDQGATPLHVAKDASTIEILVGSQGHVNATDCNGNTALHIKCLGKAGQATETDCITTLVKSNLTRASRVLVGVVMPLLVNSNYFYFKIVY
jgi:ankyrin repeat protein